MSIHKRATGWVVSYYDGPTHRSKYFGARAYGTMADAEQAAREWELARRPIVAVEDARPSLGVVVLGWDSAQNLHRNTRNTIKYLMSGPAAPLMDRPAESLTRLDLENLRHSSREAGASPQTINKHQAYISAALGWAMETGLILTHPWRGIKKLKAPAKAAYSVTLEDFRRIIDASPEWLRWAMAIAYAAALRPGQVELFGLEWSVMNWQRRTMAITMGKTGRVKEVPVGDAFVAEAHARYSADHPRGYKYMVHRGDGQRIKSYRTSWLASLRRAGLKGSGIRPYDLRHIVATQLLDQGVPLPVVAQRLGHATPAITASVYSHALDYRSREAAEMLPPLEG